MHLPPTLSQLLLKSQTVLNQHPDYDLPLGYRHALYQAMGMPVGSVQSMTIGHQRRIMLALLGVRRVLPLWQQPDLYGRDPLYLVAATEDILHGRPVAPDFPRHFFHPGDNDDPIGIAATWAFDVARVDRDCPQSQPDLALTDFAVSQSHHDTAFFAAVAEVQTPYWLGGSRQQWRIFWQWWLDEAVPNAWSIVS
jgi:hypothetical protein